MLFRSGVIGFRSLRVAGIGPDSGGARLGLFGFGASATIAIQVANHWGCESYVVTRSAAEAERARALGAAWAGTYDERLPVPLDAAVTFAPRRSSTKSCPRRDAARVRFEASTSPSSSSSRAVNSGDGFAQFECSITIAPRAHDVEVFQSEANGIKPGVTSRTTCGFRVPL